MALPPAVLLIGPTGAGKTPLGELLQRRGLWGRPCRHFDFGSRIRRIVAGTLECACLTPAEAAFLRDILESGALLADEHFPIAEKILRAFLAEGDASGGTIIVLNGLPRHASQAGDVERILAVRAVLELACEPKAVLARIRTNAGGDRAERTDDDGAAVRRKLEIYRSRTAPLLAHYRRSGVAVLKVKVGPATTAEDVLGRLRRRPAPGGIASEAHPVPVGEQPPLDGTPPRPPGNEERS